MYTHSYASSPTQQLVETNGGEIDSRYNIIINNETNNNNSNSNNNNNVISDASSQSTVATEIVKIYVPRLLKTAIIFSNQLVGKHKAILAVRSRTTATKAAGSCTDGRKICRICG